MAPPPRPTRRRWLQAGAGATLTALGSWAGWRWWQAAAQREQAQAFQREWQALPRLAAAGKVAELGMAGFLNFWSEQALLRLRRAHFPLDDLQRQLLREGTLLMPPAPADEIQAAEQRLGLAWPPALQALYAASNGLHAIIDYGQAPITLLPVSQTDWLHQLAPDLVRIWADEQPFDATDAQYFRYGPGQDTVHLRSRYMKHLLCLSPVVDSGVLALNPAVRFPDDEYETWDFSVKYPGAHRFRSLAELLEMQCEADCSNLDLWSFMHDWQQHPAS
jgi:hypothetical protein